MSPFLTPTNLGAFATASKDTLAVVQVTTSSQWSQWSEWVPEWLQAVAGLLLAIAAVLGVLAWKWQKKYDKKVEAAAEVLYRVLECEAVFASARMLMLPVDVKMNSEQLEVRVRELQRERLQETAKQFNELTRAISRMDLWEMDFCKRDLHDLKMTIADVSNSFSAFYGAKARGDFDANDDGMKKLYVVWQKTLWGAPGDELDKKLVKAANGIRARCRRIVK